MSRPKKAKAGADSENKPTKKAEPKKAAKASRKKPKPSSHEEE